jgi:hypothetical protein
MIVSDEFESEIGSGMCWGGYFSIFLEEMGKAVRNISKDSQLLEHESYPMYTMLNLVQYSHDVNEHQYFSRSYTIHKF